MKKTLAIVALAIASLGTFAAAPPRDPCYIAWEIETPMLWMACLVDHGREIVVTSTKPMASDPLWAEVQEWAEQDGAPVPGSDLDQCVDKAIAACKWGVESVELTVGPDTTKCKFTCFPPPSGPPPVSNPPSKAAD